MKKIVLILVLGSIHFFSSAQNSGDTSLDRRLNEYFQLNVDARFEQLMDYVHPSLFAMAPRQQLIEFFRNTYDNASMHLSIDSTTTISISPGFREGNVEYRKVNYWMGVHMVFKDSQTVHDPEFVKKTTDLLKIGFPNALIRYQSQNSFFVGSDNLLIAIKDTDHTPWMFLGYTKNENFIRKLFTPSVIDHFHLL